MIEPKVRREIPAAEQGLRRRHLGETKGPSHPAFEGRVRRWHGTFLLLAASPARANRRHQSPRPGERHEARRPTTPVRDVPPMPFAGRARPWSITRSPATGTLAHPWAGARGGGLNQPRSPASSPKPSPRKVGRARGTGRLTGIAKDHVNRQAASVIGLRGGPAPRCAGLSSSGPAARGPRQRSAARSSPALRPKCPRKRRRTSRRLRAPARGPRPGIPVAAATVPSPAPLDPPTAKIALHA